MKIHPVSSIFLGVIVSLILYLIVHPLFAGIWFDAVIIIFSYTIGGFISVFYARKKKIQYALYNGICVMLIIVLLAFNASSDVSKIVIFYYSVLILLLAVTGGMIGLMTDKNYRQSFKTKYLDKKFNLIAIVTGIIITFILWIFVFIVTYSNIHPTNPSIFSLVLIETVELIGISVIGGFIATSMVKEKRLLTGISVGLGIIIITIVLNVYEIIKGHPNPYIVSNPPFFLIANLGYVIAPTLGAYLAIILYNKSKTN